MDLPPHDCAEINTALALLRKASDFAADVGELDWNFAVEIQRLTAVGVTACDLRWLLHKELISHGIEKTTTGHKQRWFDPGTSSFSERSCFVLTEHGKTFLQQLYRQEQSKHGDLLQFTDPPSTTQIPSSEKPLWNSQRRELTLGGVIVKQYKIPAPNQELILTCFEEDGWPDRIDDPLPAQPDITPKRRLHDAICSLNRCQKERLIRFMGDGSGEGVRWTRAAEDSASA